MAELLKTKALLAKGLAQNWFDSYALVVGLGEQEWVYTSDNVDMDTYFDAASVGKVYPTSTLVLQAVSEGRLSLSDTLGKFFPEAPADKRDVTVTQLLNHTSGILRSEFPCDVAKEGRKSILAHVLSQPVAFAPEQYSAYSCDALLLLGFILEQIYEMPLDELFAKKLLAPLGLSRSKYNVRADEENVAICYHRPNPPLPYLWDDCNVTAMQGIPAGNGGNYCTAADLRVFVRALMARDERLYSRELYDVAERNYTKDIPPLPDYPCYGNYGLGYEYVDELCPEANSLFPEGSVGKTGYTGQTFYFNRDMGLYVILLTNATRYTVLRFGEERYEEVCKMRREIHAAIREDLAL